ncbi:DNA-binding protein [Pseudomonas sp. KFB-139]|uniref:DNA-binding protein n=1 Tax=Pseudomonas serbiensis TaxID=3064350 RepID=A0ABT9CJH4_9PSED|nr:DNA-binding protein [Pseudomonas sp. KFB-138]MDO7925634.1 DNA-binding protein [Pseudomonas sp. KFB-138]
MARGGVNKALVNKARLALLSRGENPSIDAVRVEMGNTGSKTTIHRYLKELDETDTPAPAINDELTELVARLAQRLQEQAQERIDFSSAEHDANRKAMQQDLATAQQRINELQEQLARQTEAFEQQSTALLHQQQARQGEQMENARLLQANQDLEARLQDKDGQIRSLEEKHRHAREALEHYRNSITEQRTQEQQRHEGQLQQVQMELRQAQQSLMMRQEEITRLNRDNERLLTESRNVARELESQKDLLSKTTQQAASTSEQYQHSQTQCALFEERLRTTQDENTELKQSLVDTRQQNRMLELLLIKKEVALENLREPDEKPKPKKTSGPTAKAKPDK